MTFDTATGQIGLFEEAEEYSTFTEKFKAKKTTDDCYTPENIYNAVADWVAREYGVDREKFIRPFWPGGDYTRTEYPDGFIVVDNPPFSIRAQIVDWYMAKGVRFFLFSPALTLLTRRADVCHIATGASITYENGADVPTSFITNLERSALRTAPELYRAIKAANDQNLLAVKKQLPKYSYPNHVITAAIAQRWCHYGIDYRLEPEDTVGIGALDAQRAAGKSIFGNGYLLSDRAAAERAAAERAAATEWALSDREKEIVAQLGTTANGERT